MSLERPLELRQINPQDFLSLKTSLNKETIAIEQLLLQYHDNGEKIKKPLIQQYRKAIADLSHFLFDVSKHIFKNIDIRHVQPYEDNKAVPPDYRRYLNASQNIMHFVLYDILSEKDKIYAGLLVEKWVNSLKLLFEMNDYFTATSIVSALSSLPILKSGLENCLSQTAKGVLHYLQELFGNQASIFQLQKTRFDEGITMVPILSTLSKMIDGLNNHPVDESNIKNIKSYIRRSRRSYSRDFSFMQLRSPSIDDPNVLHFGNIICKDVNLDFSMPFDEIPLKQIKNALSLCEQINLSDRFYCYLIEMKSQLRLISQSELYYRQKVGPGAEWDFKAVIYKRVEDILRSQDSYEDKYKKMLDLKPAFKKSKKLKSTMMATMHLLQNLANVQTALLKKEVLSLRSPRSKDLILTKSGFFSRPVLSEVNTGQPSEEKDSPKLKSYKQ